MHEERNDQHAWLDRLVGEWTSEAECLMGPDQPAQTMRGTETVRSHGDLWVIAESVCEMPGGGSARNIMTLGYDLRRGRFVGTFTASVMTHLWIYDGSLDAAGRVLTLDADGPDFFTPGKTGKFRDVIESVDDGHRILTSHFLTDDGTWVQFMTAHYRRQG